MIKRFLFPTDYNHTQASLGIFIIRIGLGFTMMTHGFAKLSNFEVYVTNFWGGSLGLGLTIFAELICALSMIIGIAYRLVLIPLITTMFVAFFFVHKSSLIQGELSLVYFIAFVGLLISGPGKYSVDRILAKRILGKQDS